MTNAKYVAKNVMRQALLVPAATLENWIAVIQIMAFNIPIGAIDLKKSAKYKQKATYRQQRFLKQDLRAG